jgi:hypothetical protein
MPRTRGGIRGEAAPRTEHAAAIDRDITAGKAASGDRSKPE